MHQRYTAGLKTRLKDETRGRNVLTIKITTKKIDRFDLQTGKSYFIELRR